MISAAKQDLTPLVIALGFSGFMIIMIGAMLVVEKVRLMRLIRRQRRHRKDALRAAMRDIANKNRSGS